jgi:raffinose/stachyose/melibiose transport system substrate-binding protein
MFLSRVKQLARCLTFTCAAALALPGAQALADTSVTLYTWRQQEASLWQYINDNNLIEGVTVELKPIVYDTYQSHVLLDLRTGKADLFQWAPGAANLKPLIDKGLIAPLGNNLAQINPSARLASLGPDQRYYGVPFALQLQSLIGNAKLLKQHDITTAPASMSELEDYFATLKRAGVVPLHLAISANWYVSQLLAEVLVAGLVNEQYTRGLIEGQQCFNDPRYTAIFSQLKQWQSQGYLNKNLLTEDYTGMNNAIGLGQSALAIEGGWKAGPESNFYNIDPDYQFTFWPIPGEPGKVYALGDGSYQVNAQSSQRASAEKVLRFSATREFAELFARHVNELPAYGGKLNIAEPNLARMSQLVANNAYTESLFTAYELGRNNPSYNDLVIEAIRGLLDGTYSPAEAGEHIQQGLNGWDYIGANTCR